jgi:hypothetical protein
MILFIFESDVAIEAYQGGGGFKSVSQASTLSWIKGEPKGASLGLVWELVSSSLYTPGGLPSPNVVGR